MAVRLTVECGDRTSENLQDLVNELAGDLNQLTGADAVIEEVAAAKGSRGDVVSLGNLLLTFITSGAAVAAIGVIKTYFEREPALKIRFKGADGEEFAIDATLLSDNNTERALELLARSVAKPR